MLFGCRKDHPPLNENPMVQLGEKQVYILNEGSFQFGNAKLSSYNPKNNEVISNYFETVNNQSIGDVLQSICRFRNNYYLVINNSSKIIVTDLNFKYRSEIIDLQSPRYFLPINNSKAYVTDLYSDAVQVVNLNSNERESEIRLNGWTEQLILFNGNIYLTNFDSEYLYVIDSRTDLISDSLKIGFGALEMIEDKNSNFWVLSNGNLNEGTAAFLAQIDPSDLSLIQKLEFEQSDAPSRLNLNSGLDTLYYLNKHIFQMSIQATKIPSAPFYEGSGHNFYGLGISPYTNRIYVSDAKDYIQSGEVFIVNQSGTEVDSFDVGINPGSFYFE